MSGSLFARLERGENPRGVGQWLLWVAMLPVVVLVGAGAMVVGFFIAWFEMGRSVVNTMLKAGRAP